jgi:hypothetical protein
MERINKPARKLTGIPELDALGKALDEHERLAADQPVTIRGLAEGIAKAQIKTLEKHYTLARLQEEDVLDEARELLEGSKRHSDTDEEK